MFTHIQNIYNWCFTPIGATPKEGRFYSLLALVFLADVIISTVFVSLFIAADVDLPVLTDDDIPIVSLWFLSTILIISIFEEGIFRIIPMITVMRLTSQRWIIFAVAIISSILFGLIHGGVYNIFIQGIGGFLYCIVFIKYSENGTNFKQAAWVVIAIHTLFNGLIGLILLLSGETMF